MPSVAALAINSSISSGGNTSRPGPDPSFFAATEADTVTSVIVIRTLLPRGSQAPQLGWWIPLTQTS